MPAGLLRPFAGLIARYADAALKMRSDPPRDGSDRSASAARAPDDHVGGTVVPAFAASLEAYVATRVPTQDVDDVVQDVLLRWVERAGSLEPEALEPWLITTARNRAIDVLRRRGALHADGDVELAGAAEEPAAQGALADLVD